MNSDIRWLQPLQRTQRTLAMGVHNLDPNEVLLRETWQLAADYLTQRWFPRSNDLAIGELIRECYLHALWWYPILQQRYPGTYRPSWFTGSLLSWFRRSASKTTGQWFYATFCIEAAPTIEAAKQQGRLLPGAGNAAWVDDSLGFLAQLAATGKRKSVMARYILELVAFLDWDRMFNEAWECRARPSRRRVLRTARQGTVSYLRHGRIIHLLADSHRVKQSGEYAWIDLREEAVPVLDYLIGTVQVDKTDRERLLIQLQCRVVAEARANIKAIVTGKRSAPARLHELRRFLYKFEAQHRFTPGAWGQFVDLSRYAASQAKRHIKAQLASGSDMSIPRIRVTNTLIIPGTNPFLKATPLDEWERWFSPYRCL